MEALCDSDAEMFDSLDREFSSRSSADVHQGAEDTHHDPSFTHSFVFLRQFWRQFHARSCFNDQNGVRAMLAPIGKLEAPILIMKL